MFKKKIEFSGNELLEQALEKIWLENRWAMVLGSVGDYKEANKTIKQKEKLVTDMIQRRVRDNIKIQQLKHGQRF